MIRSHLFFVLLLSFCFSTGYSQEKNYDISAPTDLPQTGVNKVLCMKNGNTMLFHFEPNKQIRVIVFDSLHKQIADKEDKCKLMRTLKIDDAVFKGLFEVDGESVLFFDEDLHSKHTLVRLQFNAKNGILTHEAIVAKSDDENRRMQFFVMKNKDAEGYAILFNTDVRHPKSSDISVDFFDTRHKIVRTVSLFVDREKYDLLNVIGAESQANGICISLGLEILKEHATTGPTATPAIYDHYIKTYYIPKDTTTNVIASAAENLSTDIYPFYTNYTYDPFAGTLNLLLLSYHEVEYRFGLELLPASDVKHLFISMDENKLDPTYKWITNTAPSAVLKQKKDANAFYEGLPVDMHTDENGLTTVISESYSRFWEPESRVRTNIYTYLGNIGITQLDDHGNELWGTVLPLKQRYDSYHAYYPVYALSKKWQTQALFGDLPAAVYDRQFVSFNTYYFHKNIYIIFNDLIKNFNNSIEHPGDTVYAPSTTNACYYKIDAKKEITKHYLFGTPEANEYRASFIEGACFDEKRGVYASLIQYKKGDDVSLRMAWRKLD